MGFEPAGEIHRAVDRWNADVAQVSGAVPRGDIHAAAEGNRKVGVVTAHAVAFVERLAGRLGRSCILVAERDVSMDVVADRLDARPARWRLGKELPADIRQPVRLAIAAAPEKPHRPPPPLLP